MLEILIGIIIGFIVLYGLTRGSFKRAGKAQGICKEVRVEVTQDDGSPYNEQMRGTDSRMYRIYIQYEWKGKQYIAKTYRAYSSTKYFPGDVIPIWVNKDNKNIVDIRH